MLLRITLLNALFMLLFGLLDKIVLSTDHGIWREGIEIFREHTMRSKIKGPKYILIGARKSATASVFETLVDLGNLCYPLKSEIHYFNSDEAYNHGSSFYEAMFGSCRESEDRQIDYTPNYFEDDRVPYRMNETFKASSMREKKLILVLREPIRRSFSLYSQLVKTCVSEMHKHMQTNGRKHRWDAQEICSISRYCKALRCGTTRKKVYPSKLWDLLATYDEYYKLSGYSNKPLPPSYADRIKTYLKFFDRSQIFIINYDRLVKEPHIVFPRLFKFMDLPDLQWNKDAKFRHEKWNHLRLQLGCQTRDSLGNRMEAFNNQLHNLIKAPGAHPLELPFGRFSHWTNVSCGSGTQHIAPLIASTHASRSAEEVLVAP